jgi:hypothetical protein
MCEVRVIFPFSNDKVFEELCQEYTATMRGVLRNTFGFGDVNVVKLSFMNYCEKCVHDSFPFNKQLVIHNISLLDKFGFGRYVGAFFDVIISIPSGNLTNHRIFYGIDGEMTPAPTAAPTAAPAPVPSPATEQTQTVNILGQERPFVKRGRTTYVNIDGKEYTLTEARKLEASRKR